MSEPKKEKPNGTDSQESGGNVRQILPQLGPETDGARQVVERGSNGGSTPDDRPAVRSFQHSVQVGLEADYLKERVRAAIEAVYHQQEEKYAAFLKGIFYAGWVAGGADIREPDDSIDDMWERFRCDELLPLLRKHYPQ